MNLTRVKNPWACENTTHGSGLKGCPLEIYLCPRCGAHPTMADDGYGNTGLLCMECGFGIKPTRHAVEACWKWNKAVEQFVQHLVDNLCAMCHYYGGCYEPDPCFICNSPEHSRLMNAPMDIANGKDPREICRDYVRKKDQ